MGNVLTFNQIIEIFREISQHHLQIKGFFVGKNWELNDANDPVEFPLLQIKPLTASLPIANGVKKYPTAEFSIYVRVLDRLDKGEANKSDVYSDTFQIIQDIINLISCHPYFVMNRIELNTSISCLPEEELTTEYAAGWSTVFTITIRNVNSYCGLPMNDWSDVTFPTNNL
jgi:hypothetical protein